MNRYEGAECPYCHQTLHADDEITVCPQCGAPYHRACAQKSGGCVLQELHAEGKQWQKIARPGVDEVDGRAQQRCSRCGTLNSPGALFCEICGSPLQNQQPNQPGNAPYNQQGWQGGNNMGGMQPPPQMPFNPYVNPMAGLDPEEPIDDIPAKEVAIFVKSNTQYFLPKFKDMTRPDPNGKKKIASWNWSAFIFDTYYLFYRKMYLLGAVVMVLSLLFSIPSLLMSFDNLMTLVDESSTFIVDLGISPQKLMTLYSMCNFFSLVMKLLLALFTNKLYKEHTFKSIRKIKAEHGGSPDYHTTLSAKGGVSMVALLIAFGLTMLISVLSSTLFIQYIGL